MKQTSQEIQFGESRKSSNVSSLASNETTLTECKTRVIMLHLKTVLSLSEIPYPQMRILAIPSFGFGLQLISLILF